MFYQARFKKLYTYWNLIALSKLMINSKTISGAASTTPTDFIMVLFSACAHPKHKKGIVDKEDTH